MVMQRDRLAFERGELLVVLVRRLVFSLSDLNVSVIVFDSHFCHRRAAPGRHFATTNPVYRDKRRMRCNA